VPVQPHLALRDQEADDGRQPRDVQKTGDGQRREVRLSIAPRQEYREQGSAERDRHLEDGGIELNA
jgi:hypothetical protein